MESRRISELWHASEVRHLVLLLTLTVGGCVRQNAAEEASVEDDVALYFDKTAPGQGIIFLNVSIKKNQVDAVQGSIANDGSVAAERHAPLDPSDRDEIQALFASDRSAAYRADNNAGRAPSQPPATPSKDGRCPDGSTCPDSTPCLCLPPARPNQETTYVVDYRSERLYYLFDDDNGDITADLLRRLEAMHGRYLSQ